MEPGFQVLNVMSTVFGLDNTCYMRYSKRNRNPDTFTYNNSIDYKEDFELVDGSYCNCGCKSAVYTKEEGYGDDSYTEIITQPEYEKLPRKPQPTKEQVKLQTDIIRADREETELGIIHGQDMNNAACGMIPVPKLEYRIPDLK